VLAAQTAADCGAQARERESARSRDPLVRELARVLLDASEKELKRRNACP